MVVMGGVGEWELGEDEGRKKIELAEIFEPGKNHEINGSSMSQPWKPTESRGGHSPLIGPTVGLHSPFHLGMGILYPVFCSRVGIWGYGCLDGSRIISVQSTFPHAGDESLVTALYVLVPLLECTR